MIPFVWSRLQTKNLSDASTLIFNEAREFGLQDGISVPIRGLGDTFSLFSAVADGTQAEQAEALQRQAQSIAYMAVLMHERTVHLIGANGTLDETAPHLTPREREVLKWVASGKTSSDIADILKIAETTVNTHVESASLKLNATTRAHAAVLAILAGIVDPV
jgi:DNA-binding CsgD family transcriptional regulator